MHRGRHARNALDSGKVLPGAARLLARHWPMLVALSAGGLLLREYVLEAALFLSRHTAVGGMLMLSLAPLVAMLVTVAMLLYMQGSAIGRQLSMRVVIVSLGSMIGPFLVVYEHYGNMSEDLRAYAAGRTDANVEEALLSGLAGDGSDGIGIPEGTSPLVIITVAGALIVRSLANRWASTLQSRPDEVGIGRTGLQMLSGYADVVWVVVGVITVTTVADRVADWWSSRLIAHWLADTWEQIAASAPILDDLASAIVPATGDLLSALLVGLVVPISWLAFGLIVYGTQAADVLGSSLGSNGPAGRIMRRMTTRVSPATVEKAWQLSLDPELRFGPLIGGLGMIRRASGISALAFCLAYVAVSEAGQLVWTPARWLVGPGTSEVWSSLAPLLDAGTSIVVQVLTACLLAAAAGSLVRGFTRDEAEEDSSGSVNRPAGASSRG